MSFLTVSVRSSLAVGVGCVMLLLGGCNDNSKGPNTAPTVTTSTLPEATIDAVYSQTLTAKGGTSPYTWSINDGSLPPGLSLSPAGVISGTPTFASSFSVTVLAEDSEHYPVGGLATFDIVVAPPPVAITTTTLPGGSVGIAYSQTLAVSGGAPSYTWSISSGSLPAGLTLSPNTGAISGTPTSAATSNFTVKVTDSQSTAATATSNFSINIAPPPPVIMTSTLSDGTIGIAYSQTLSAIDGILPYTWSISSGSLPAGLALAPSTGVISGKPTTAAVSSFTVKLTDSESTPVSTTANLSIGVDAFALVITTSTLPDGLATVPYSQTLAATGGTLPYIWTVTSGSLPAGLTLSSSTGVISGAPTTAGMSNFTVQLADAEPTPATTTVNLSLNIGPAPPMVVSGNVDSGVLPVYNSTVTLYAMNTSTANYGDSPAQYAQVPTAYDGSFTFSRLADGTANANADAGSDGFFACPGGTVPGTATDPELYLVGSGGDTSGTINAGNATSAYNNTAAKFILPLGDCNSLSSLTNVRMNEVTTAATMISLQQFFNPMTENIGAPSTNITGLVNAVGTVANLVDTVNGLALQTTTPASTVVGVTMAGVSEYQKLNTIANILNACTSTNSATSTACTTLVTNAVPPGVGTPAFGPNAGAANPITSASTNFPAITSYPSAADTLLAVDFMSINPTESQDYKTGAGKLFNLYTLSMVNTTPPFQPALATQSYDWTIGISYTATGTCTNAAAAAPLGAPYGLAIDKSGDIWVMNDAAKSALVEFTPQGGAINCLGGTYTAGRNAAVDAQGNIWATATSPGVAEYVLDPTNRNYGSIVNWPPPTTSAGVVVGPDAIIADASGNIFVSQAASVLAPPYEYIGAATATAATAPVALNVVMGKTVYPYAAAASNGAIYFLGISGQTLYGFVPTGTPGSYAGINIQAPSAILAGYGLAFDSNGNIVGGNTADAYAGRLWKVNTSTNSLVSGGVSPNFPGGSNATRGLAVDGANNIWTGGVTSQTSGKVYGVAETDTSFNALSPAGVVPASGYASDGSFQKSFLGQVYTLQVDASGNVWGVVNTEAPQPNMFQIVGAAVPVKTPIVSNLR